MSLQGHVPAREPQPLDSLSALVSLRRFWIRFLLLL